MKQFFIKNNAKSRNDIQGYVCLPNCATQCIGTCANGCYGDCKASCHNWCSGTCRGNLITK